jgi:hypothetical protein
MSALEPAAHDRIAELGPAAYVRAVLNILEDFSEEKHRLEET